MRIAEIYSSRQGEGILTGMPSVFVRTSGCNLRCGFCDTPFTSWEPEGTNRSVDEIVETVGAWPDQNVVITGGEPMLSPDIVELTHRIAKLGHHITIETAGTILRDVACDLMSISPKLANSTPDRGRAGEWAARHERDRLNLPVLRALIAGWEYQLKFVVAKPADLDGINALLDQLPGAARAQIWLMPEGTDAEILAERMTWLEPLCAREGFHPCPRMHITWYGHQRGT
jgi:7-carboxy-7-deazaguanine synthase